MPGADTHPAENTEPRQRLTPRHVAVVVVAAVAMLAVCSPLFWSTDRDSYPLSTYPMFATDRGRLATYATAVGIDGSGAEHFLSPELIAQTNEPVQASETATREVRAGRAEELCRSVAAAAAGTELVSVAVISATYDVVAWFDGDRVPLERTVHATCPTASGAGR